MVTENYGNISIKGVDISFCQTGINYNDLKSGDVKFAIIRAGHSETVDRLLETHVKGCRDVGIDYGFYWYSGAKNVEEARCEAAACLKAIGKFPDPKYPVFFDGEENSIAVSVGKTVMTDIALAFVEEIENGGYPAGIYTNPDWMENKYDNTRIIGKTDVWLACWTNNPAVHPHYDFGQTMWQWGIESYKMDVDADVCFVDYPAKTAEWYADHPGKSKDTKTVEQIAVEVLEGLWGNGEERKQRLTDAGYDYETVQAEVDRLIK